MLPLGEPLTRFYPRVLDFANGEAAKDPEADDAADLHDRKFLRRGSRLSRETFEQITRRMLGAKGFPRTKNVGASEVSVGRRSTWDENELESRYG